MVFWDWSVERRRVLGLRSLIVEGGVWSCGNGDGALGERFGGVGVSEREVLTRNFYVFFTLVFLRGMHGFYRCVEEPLGGK